MDEKMKSICDSVTDEQREKVNQCKRGAGFMQPSKMKKNLSRAAAALLLIPALVLCSCGTETSTDISDGTESAFTAADGTETPSAAAEDTGSADTGEKEAVIAEGLPKFTVQGETKLTGNFFLSFVYSRNIIMLDGKGNIVWSKHEEQPAEGLATGWWDFKKHVIDGKTYYSYHDQTGTYDDYGMLGYAPGERVILDDSFHEIKRITLEESDVSKKGDPVDGHDFLMFDLDHYILSSYRHDTVYNIPDYPEGSKVVYSYLQEVDHGNVVWDWKSIDYPELYAISNTDSSPTANDFANEQTDAPDYVHFNSMRLTDDGNLLCSFRHLSTVMSLDRTKREDQILWKLSGTGDEFGLTDAEKTSGQHYVTMDGNYVSVFDNDNKGGITRMTSYLLDTDKKETFCVKRYSFNQRFTDACGSFQHLPGDVYVIGWGHSTKDADCMTVIDADEGVKKMTVTLENPDNFTYRCVYYE